LRPFAANLQSFLGRRNIVSMSAAWHEYHAQYTRTFHVHGN
jgi:hypothetical protein